MSILLTAGAPRKTLYEYLTSVATAGADASVSTVTLPVKVAVIRPSLSDNSVAMSSGVVPALAVVASESIRLTKATRSSCDMRTGQYSRSTLNDGSVAIQVPATIDAMQMRRQTPNEQLFTIRAKS